MADLENGLFSGASAGKNTGDPSISWRFVTAIVKGEPAQWAIRGGNADSGSLSTFYNGVRPSGYNPMHKEGAIILGTGGDNSNGAQGTFYEGVMTSGYPSDETENAVQADIVAAKYATTSATGPASTTTTTPPVTSTQPSGSSQTHWGQCGGSGWTGPTTCVSPYNCVSQNAYYSQCL
jgi:hypothetical protein